MTSSTKRLIVHVGVSKTGSTAIQSGLRRSRSELARHGISYWGGTLDLAPIQDYWWQQIRPPESLFARTDQEVGFPGEFVDIVCRSLEAGPPVAIVSNDSFTTGYAWLIPLLGAVERAGIDVLIVAYVRAPSAQVQSSFAQWELKSKLHDGRVLPFGSTQGSHFHRFADKLEAFDDAFGDRFRLRNYDAVGDVLEDLLDVGGLDVSLPRREVNVRPSAEEELVRAFYNDRQSGPASPVDFWAFADPEHVDFRLDLLSWYRGLLPTQDEVDEVALALTDDLVRLNGLLTRRGQPPLADPRALTATGTVDTDRLLGLLLQLQYQQHVRLSVLEKGSASVQSLPEDERRPSRRGEQTPGQGAPAAFVLGRVIAVDSAFASTKDLYRDIGNTGNIAFRRAVYEHLGGEAAGIKVVPWSAARKQAERAGQIGVIPAANQLGRHTDFGRLARRWSSLDVGMVMIGLGAQGPDDERIPDVSEGTLSWIRGIADRAPSTHPNVGVRGTFSLRVLEHFGMADRATILGCPSLFLNPNPRLGHEVGTKMENLERVAVVAGHFGWEGLWRLEASLAKLVDDSHGSYVGQAPLEMVMLTRGEADQIPDDALARCRDFIRPGMTMHDFARWSRKHGNVFFDVANWLEHYRRFDLVVGTRIHGTVLALQAGIPALCIAHDVRTREMCHTMRIPFVPAKDVLDGVTHGQLTTLVRERFDPSEFDANRLRLCGDYVKFLRNNRIEPVPWLVALSSAREAAERRP